MSKPVADNNREESLEEIIELREAIDSNFDFQKDARRNGLDFTCAIQACRNNETYQRHSLTREKDSEDSENSETINLIYPYTTLRLRNTSPDEIEQQVTTIANHIERRNKHMQNDPLCKTLRLEMIRNMPQSLTLKRSVKAKLTLSVKSDRKPIGYWKKLKYQISIMMSKTNLAFRQVSSSIELWYNPIKMVEGHFGSGIATYFKFLRWLFVVNTISCIFSIFFITLPQALEQFRQNEDFSTWDLLLGNGILTNSIFYYGFYRNDTLMINSKVAYDMPSAYFSTFLFCYLFTFLLLCIKVAGSYKKCYIETSGGAYNRYANKIFCSWDWGISSYRAASLRSASIYRELEELLWESKKEYSPITCSMKVWTLLIRVAMTTLVSAILCGTGVLLWLLLNEYQVDDSNNLLILIVPVVMTSIVNFIPPLLSWSVKYERYTKDRIAFYVTMIRVYMIAVIAVATLLTFWLTRGVQVGCWETRLAQEVYRLVVLDLLVSIFGVFIVQAIRSSKYVREKLGAPTFDIARNTLNLIYNQSLFWLVHYFSPPMSLLVVAKLLLTFYIKKSELLNFCEPPSKFWRAAQTQTLFLALTFLGLISVITVLSYVIIYVNTGSCGPFAGSNYTWELIIERVLHVRRDSKLWSVLGEVASPGTGIALLITMCIAVYYLRAKAEASKQMVRILREMLVWQARDKEFLLKTFNSASTDKRWLRHRRSSKLTPESNVTNITHDRSHINEPSTSY